MKANAADEVRDAGVLPCLLGVPWLRDRCRRALTAVNLTAEKRTTRSQSTPIASESILAGTLWDLLRTAARMAVVAMSAVRRPLSVRFRVPIALMALTVRHMTRGEA